MKRLLACTATAVLLSVTTVSVQAASVPADQDNPMLQGERRIMGTVEEVKSDQIKVNTGEIQPRFIPLKPAKDKGLPMINEGDKIEITVNDQNLVVDYHLIDASGHSVAAHDHQVVKGRIAKAMAVGHEKAVIETKDGQEKSYEIRPQARSKMASIPVGIEAVFLVDETNKIVDVNFKDKAAAQSAGKVPEKKSPPKGTR
jgi:ribosomal protein S1